MVTLVTSGMLDAAEAGAIVLDFSNCSWFGAPDVVVSGVFSDFNHDASDAPAYQVCIGTWFYDSIEAAGQWDDAFELTNDSAPPTTVWDPNNGEADGVVDFDGAEIGGANNAVLFFAPGGIGSHGFTIELSGIPGDDIEGVQAYITNTKSLASVTTSNGVPEYVNFGAPPLSCFWTDIVGNASQDCDEAPPPPPFGFAAGGNNNVTEVTITDGNVPVQGAAVGPSSFEVSYVYNAVLYFSLNDDGGSFFGTYGALPDTYAGALTGGEVQKINKDTLAVVDTISVGTVPVEVLDYGNGNMFQGFSGPITGMPALDDGFYWKLVGHITLTDQVGPGDPVDGDVEVDCSQGPAEVRCITFPGGQDPDPFPFYSFGDDGGAYVEFADTGGYGCDDQGSADFTVDGVPKNVPNFVNSCS